MRWFLFLGLRAGGWLLGGVCSAASVWVDRHVKGATRRGTVAGIFQDGDVKQLMDTFI